MSGTLTIQRGSNRVVYVLSNNGLEEFNIPNDDNYQLILNEDCKIRISNNTVDATSCRLQTDNNSNITMKVLKMSSSETDINHRFYDNKWLKDFSYNVRDNWNNVTNMSYMFHSCTKFNGNLSNTKFKSNVNKGSGASAYDYNTPLWEAKHKPQFVL